MNRPARLTKTTIYLAEADYRKVRAIARKQKRTTAQLLRDAVAQYAGRAGARRKLRSVAAGRSGRSDLSERAEAVLKGMGRGRSL